jgi:hypothetical protein
MRILVEGTSLPMSVHLVDVSAAALAAATQALADAAHLAVVPHEASFEHGLNEVGRQPTDGTTMVMLIAPSSTANSRDAWPRGSAADRHGPHQAGDRSVARVR